MISELKTAKLRYLLWEHFFKDALCDDWLYIADPQRCQPFRITGTVSQHTHTHNDVSPSGLLGLFHNIHTLLDYTEEKKQTNKHLCNSKTTWVSQRKRRTILDFNDASNDHISDTLVSLHWLCVPGCIEYNIAVLVYKVQPGLAPHYLGPLTRVRSSRSSFRRHKPSSHSTCQVVHGRHPNLLGCRT